MEDFRKEYVRNIAVITVTLTRATLKEAQELKKIIDEELLFKSNKIILDLSECEFIDSTFLGVIIYQNKRLIEKGGKLYIVEPVNLWGTLFSISRTLEKLNLFKTKEQAFNEMNADSE